MHADTPSMREIASKREAWGTFLGLFCGNYVWYFLLTWLPFYLEKYRGFSKGKLAILGALPFFAIAVSATVFGYLSDWLIARGYTATQVRKSFIVTGLLLSTIMLPSATATGETTAIVLLVVGAGCLGLYSANLWAVTQTLAGPSAAGKWTGMQNGIGNLAGVVCPALTGYLADRTGSFVLPFAVVAAVLVCGAFSFGVIVRRVEPIRWSRTGAATQAVPVA
jgi:cyanate permease